MDLTLRTGVVAATPATLSDSTIISEARLIAYTIMGNAFFTKTEVTGASVLPHLLASLTARLQKFKDNNVAVTLDIIKKEASTWVYRYMREHNKKISCHPPSVKDIARKWMANNQDEYYPSNLDVKVIAKDIGLKQKQVQNLFQNERKRAARNPSGAARKFNGHFSKDITMKLREWQTQNQNKKQPAGACREELMQATALDQYQIRDWFNNHKPGRNRSKKKIPMVA